MKNLTRLDFLKLSASGAIATATIGGFAGCSPASRRNIPLGVQLYSVRHELEQDFDGTLAKLANMGFEGVEFADYYGKSAGELRTILDVHNLRCCGTHIYLDVLLGDQFNETVEFNKTLGNKYFIIRWINEEDRNTHDSFLQTIDQYNEVVERLDEHGMRLGYHNHDYIFEKFGDQYLWDILAENTDERFILQLDTGHAAGIGMDPEELIRRHPGRTTTIHAKPYSSVNEEAVIGEDELDWSGIIQASKEEGGIEWFILEYEIAGVPPLEALEECLQNFRNM